MSTYTLSRRVLAICSIALGLIVLPNLHAQMEFERVDHADQNGINRIRINTLIHASDGTPVLFADDGVYHLDYDVGSDGRAVRVDSTHFLAPLPIRGSVIFARDAQSLYTSRDNGRSWQFLLDVTDAKVHAGMENEVFICDIKNRTLFTLNDQGVRGPAHPFDVGIQHLASTRSGVLFGVSNEIVLHRSEDRGKTWQRYATPKSGVYRVGHLFSLGDSLLVQQGVNGSAISVNGGAEWYEVIDANSDSQRYQALWMTADGTLWRQTSRRQDTNGLPYHSLDYSSDSGQTWSLCRKTYGRVIVTSSGRIYTEEDGGIVVTNECGDDRDVITSGFRNVHVRELQADKTTLYARISRTGNSSVGAVESLDLIRSDNGGTSWQIVRTNAKHAPVIDEEGTIYLRVDTLAGYYVLRSTDKGDSWHRILQDQEIFADNQRLSISSDRAGTVLLSAEFAAYNRDNVRYYVSRDSGNTFTIPSGWSDTGTFIPKSSILRADGTLLAVGTRVGRDGDTLEYGFLLFDPEESSTRWLGQTTVDYLNITENQRIYGWDIVESGVLLRSSTGGETWDTLTRPGNLMAGTGIEEMKDGLLYTEPISNRPPVVSRDDGISWQTYEPPSVLPDTRNDELPVVHPRFCADNGIVFTMAHFDRVEPGRANRVDVEGVPYYHHHTLLRSIDNGKSWSIPFGSPYIRSLDVTSVVYSSDDILLVGTRNDGIYRAINVSSVSTEIQVVPVELDLW